jgi:TatD DNase family protein
MKIIDSHCHLDRIDHSSHGLGLQGSIAQAQAAGVAHMLCISVDVETLPTLVAIAEEFDCVSLSVGVHPAEEGCEDASLERLLEFASHPKVIAFGETGLDYYHCKGDVEWQHQRFIRHIEAAKILNKPLIIHTREAMEDTFKILKEHHAQTVGGVFHCFSGSLENAYAAIDLGFLVSFAGNLTFKNATELQHVAKHLPLEHILVETDSPYLTPMPFRGKPNTPAYVKYVVEKIAELKDIAPEEVAGATTKNFCNKFKIKLT